MPVETATPIPAATETQVFTIEVAVNLTPAGAIWTYNGQSQLKINVEPGLALIELTLQSGAAYVTNPINWYAFNQQPTVTPKQISVSRESNQFTTILDDNQSSSSDASETFHFLISVTIDGKTYTSPDPTIINHKPTL